MADRILILGASARAAAASARRAGLEPFAIDLFCDRDTRLLCDCLRCPPDEYPEGLFRLANQAPPMPWMYTGGLENYPELIDDLARERKLLGNHSGHFTNVRNPYILHAVLTAHGFMSPLSLPVGRPQPEGSRWVCKRLRGSGGLGITWYDYQGSGWKGDYIQQFIPGPSMSALYVSIPWRVYLLAVTRQLVGEPWLHAKPFAYCGSIGPVEVSEPTLKTLRSIGGVITQYGPIFGLFGVDFVHYEAGPCPIEVNPRYTASIEVAEHASGAGAIPWHRDFATCLDDDGEEEWTPPADLIPKRVVGKAIYYAPHRITVPASGPWDESLTHVADVWRRPDFADIPHPGELIEPGHPVLTILTEADTEASCLARLQSRAAELDCLFGVRP